MSALDPPKALLFVYGECGPHVTEEEFSGKLVSSSPAYTSSNSRQEWYDNEHAPARLTVKGFSTALRYKATDSLQPTWLAIYDIATPEVISSDDYKSLRVKASQRESDIVSRLQTLDRRVYTLISTREHDLGQSSVQLPGKFILVVSMEPSLEGEVEFNRWYEEEHMELISKIPGWLRGRRYKILSQNELGGKVDTRKTAPAPSYLAIYEFDRPAFLEQPEMKGTATPWAARVTRDIIKRREGIRVFELYKNFGSPPA